MEVDVVELIQCVDQLRALYSASDLLFNSILDEDFVLRIGLQ